VDPNLRVFGSRNLYVCSSSVFPTSGFANPTHTIVALAFRLAEHLASLPAQHAARTAA
jgi:choline dehydrogenase-like flavoprotein